MNKMNNYPKPGSNISKYWLVNPQFVLAMLKKLTNSTAMVAFILMVGMMTSANAVTYYSQTGGSLNLNTLTNWNSVRTGGGAGTQPASAAAFTTAGNIFVIQGTGNGGTSPHSVTSTTAWAISGSATKLQIENGGTLTSTASISVGSTSIFQVDNGGTYIHNNIASPTTAGIFSGTESFGATSNVRIDNWINNTTVLTTNVTLPFGNLEINWTANTANWNQTWTGAINLTAGNFRVTSVGTGQFRFASGTAFTLTVGGNYIQNYNGTVIVSQTTSSPTINIGGNFTISAGNFIAANGAGDPIINVSGNFSQTGGNTLLVRDAGNATMNITGTCSLTAGLIGLVSSAAGAGTGTFTVTGNTTLNVTGTDGVSFQSAGTGIGIFQTQDLIIPATSTSTSIVDFGAGTITNNEFRIKGNLSKAASSGTFFTTSLTGAKGFVFNGTGTLASPQTLSYGGTASDYVSYVVNTGTAVELLTNLNNGPGNFSNPASTFTVNGTLDCSTFKINGGGANCTFTLSSGATLATANTLGIMSTTVGSVVNNITSTFNNAANYVFNGSSAQVTNFKSASQTMANLTIQNSAGVTLNGDATVNGTLTATTGTFTVGADLTIGASGNTVNNSSIAISSTFSMDAKGTQMTGTGTLSVSGTFITSRSAGFNGSASTAISNTITSITLVTGSTVDYSSGTTQTITASNYFNLTNSGNGIRTLSSTGTIGIATAFSPGTGLYTIGTSTVDFNGTTAIAAFPVPPVSSGGNYYNLLITGTNTYTMTSSLTVGNNFTMNGSGTFRVSNATPNSLTVSGNMIIQAGTVNGNGTGGSGLANINVSGNYTQSGGNFNANNATNANGGTASVNVTGTFGITGGNFTLISNNGGNATVTVNGAVTVSASGANGINFETPGSSNGAGIFQANGNAAFSGASTALVDFGTGNVVGNEFRIKGNFSKSGTGTFTTTSTNASTATGFVFNGTGTIVSPQTLSYSGNNSDKTSYQVNNTTVVQLSSSLVMGSTAAPNSAFTVLGTLDCGFNVISGGNAGSALGFTLALGATMITKNTGGILATITDLKTNYNTGGSYVFNNTVSSQNSAFKSNPQQMANLTMSNPIALNLTESAILTGTLAFTAGKIVTSTNFLTLNTGASVTGAGTSTYVNGNVLWVYPTFGSATLNFPIGSSSAYAPVTLTINGIGGSGQVFISGSTLTGAEPNEAFPLPNSSGIDQAKRSANYWTLSKGGTGSFTSYDVSFTIANTVNTGTPTNYVVRKFDPPNVWTATTLGTHTSSVTQATGLTSFSEFEVGEKNTLVAGSDPVSAAIICDDENTSFTTSASSSAPATTIQWQEKTPSGSFTDIVNGGIYGGANTVTLTLTGASTAMSANQYRAAFRNINGESTTTAAILTVNDRPTASVSGSATICDGGSSSISVSVTGSGTISGTLSPGAIPFSGTAPTISVSVSPTSNTTYSVATLADANCSSTAVDLTGSHTVNVNSRPTASVSGSSTICDGGSSSISISVTGSGTISGTLSPGAIPFSGTAPTISVSVSPTSNTTYSVATLTDANCTSDAGDLTGSHTVNVDSRPTASVSGTSTICDGGSSSISISVTGSGTISGTLSPGAVPFSGTAPTISVSVSPSSNTSYSVATLADANCTSTAGDLTGSHTVNVDSRPTASVSGSSTICDGGSSSISISVTGSGTISGTLSPGAIPFSGTAPTISVSVSPSSNTSYSVATLADANCTSTAGDLTGSYTVNVTAAPTAAIALVGSPDKCLGQSATVSLTFTGTGPWNYTISGSGGPYSGTTSSNPANINVTPTATGTQTYTVTSTGNATCPTGGTASGSATVNVSTVPPPSSGPVPAGAAEACAGAVMLITSNVISGQNIIYSWNTGSNSSTVLFSTNVGGPFSPGPFQTTTNQVYAQFGALGGGQSGYQVCLQGVNGCGSSINKCLWLRGVVSGPGAITPANGVVACENTTQLYSCGLSAGATVYNWTLNGSAAAVTPNGGNNPTNVSVAFPSGFTTGQLCVTAALSCGGSSTSAPRCININKNPANPNVPTGAAAVCPGATGVSYSIPAVAGASGYNWTVPANATIATGANSPSITVDFPTPYNGSSSVCVTTTSACGASAVKCKTVTSGIPNQPAGITGPLANICGSTVQYSVVSPPGGLTYTWTNPAGTTISGSATGSTILLNVSSSFTSGFLTVAANSVLCAPATSVVRTSSTFWGRPNNPGTITQNPPGAFCSGASLNFSVVNPVTGPVPVYTWTSSNGVITSLQGPNNIDVTWGTNAAGTITVKASNTCGLSAGTSSQGFTPNNCREEGLSSSSVATLSAYPNPTSGKTTINFYSENSFNYTIKVIDYLGREVFSNELKAIAGDNTPEIDMSHFAKGMYLIEVAGTDHTQKVKVIVQ